MLLQKKNFKKVNYKLQKNSVTAACTFNEDHFSGA